MDMADGHMAHALPTRQYALHSIDTSRAPTWHQHDPTSSCTTFRGRAGSLVAVSLEPGVLPYLLRSPCVLRRREPHGASTHSASYVGGIDRVAKRRVPSGRARKHRDDRGHG